MPKEFVKSGSADTAPDSEDKVANGLLILLVIASLANLAAMLML